MVNVATNILPYVLFVYMYKDCLKIICRRELAESYFQNKINRSVGMHVYMMFVTYHLILN